MIFTDYALDERIMTMKHYFGASEAPRIANICSVMKVLYFSIDWVVIHVQRTVQIQPIDLLFFETFSHANEDR